MRNIMMVALALFAVSAVAQDMPRATVKFVCGDAPREVIDAFGFAPGRYFTTINVINVNTRTNLDGHKRFSVALPSQGVGPKTTWVSWKLKPGDAMQIDCGDIYKQLDIPPGRLIDGFVTIRSAPRLDVTAVYTISNGERAVAIDVREVLLR